MRWIGSLAESVEFDRLRRVGYALVAMSRPPQLLLIAVVYALGAAVAYERGAPVGGERFLGGLVAVEVVAASVHYANEYADYETDRLTDPTAFSGGSQALVETGLSRSVALWAASGALAVGVVFAGWCLLAGHLALAAAGVLAVIAVLGWQYSVGPLALAWRGLGELDNAFLGGVALPVFGYAVQADRVTPVAVAVTLPFGAVVFANLLDTTWPDREADGAVGKETLATRWPPRRLRATYAGALVVAGATLAGLTLWGAIPWPVAAASLPAAPLLVWGLWGYTRRRSPFPTVAGMVVLAVAQLLGWLVAAGLL